MSDQSDVEFEPSNIDEPEQIPSNDITEIERDNTRSDSTINPIDEESQFIFDDEMNRLICVGTTFSDIPHSIVDAYASKTKILDLSKNRFRLLDFLKNFPNLEELILDENDLNDDHSQFPKLPQLQILMINKNRLQDIYKLVDQLRQAFPQLAHLSLLGNEACPYQIIPTTNGSSSTKTDTSAFAQQRAEEAYQRFRHLLIFRIPTLRFLDASEITPDERRIATQLGDILYTIAEAKQHQTPNEEKKVERKENYTPLPSNSNHHTRITMGKVRNHYHGDGSQGNKFVQDGDL